MWLADVSSRGEKKIYWGAQRLSEAEIMAGFHNALSPALNYFPVIGTPKGNSLLFRRFNIYVDHIKGYVR